MLSLVLVLLGLGRLLGQSGNTHVYIWDKQDKYVLTPNLDVLEDKDGSLSFEEVITSRNFQGIESFPELSASAEAYWVKVELEPQKTTPVERRDWLLIFHPYNTRIDIFIEEEGQLRKYLQGTHVPIAERTYVIPSNMSPCVQKISLSGKTKVSIFAKLRGIPGNRAPFLDLELSSTEFYEKNVTQVRTFSSFIIGGLVLMIIMVIILNLYLGHESHYYYLLYLITLLFVEALTTGADTLYIPNHIGLLWDWLEPSFFSDHPKYRVYFEVRWYVLIVVYFLFIRSYLGLKTLMPIWDKIMQGMVGLGIVSTFVGLYIIHASEFNILVHDDFLGAYVGIFFLTVIIFLFALRTQKDPRGIFVTLGFTAIILSSAPTLTDIMLNDSPSGYADTYLITGLFIEKIIFTAALSFRQRTIEKQLNERKEEQKKLLAEQNRKLEETVALRTQELVQKTEQLQESMSRQQRAQSKLVEQEKMASLGLLTAGVAHEINNPINFVSANIDSLKLDLEDIKDLLEKIEALSEQVPAEELPKEIEKLIQETDTAFLFEEMSGLVEGINNGAERTKEIVKGLQNFSRLDEDGFKMADIHLGLEATLRILKSQIDPNILIHTDYAELPMLNCQPGKLNQVFMNIIHNAVQALDGKGEVFISTASDEKEAKVIIRDTGKGMSEEVRKKIFEPFFTTKEVGAGTGLGLFISLGIIENHKGRIDIESTEGQGTTFTISLPIATKSKDTA